jgi:uncharacterized BrkB/YihY/UPF0761 family membrane protein
MIVLLLALVVLIGLLIFGGLFANAIHSFAQQRLPNHGQEGESLLIWGGMLLTAFLMGLLVMYLFLRP